MDSMTPSQQRKMQEYMEATGTTNAITALTMLSASSWNFEDAITAHVMLKTEEDEMDDDEDYMDFDVPLPSPSSALFPEELGDIPSALSQFSTEFSRRYPSNLQFHTESLAKALEHSQATSKPLLLFLTHEKSVAMNIFCKKVMTNEDLVEIIHENYTLFPWDVTEIQNVNHLVSYFNSNGLELHQDIYRLAFNMTERFPLLIPFTERSMTCQSFQSAEEIIAILFNTAQDHRSIEFKKRENEERSKLMKQQNEEFMASLAQDLEKAKLKLDKEEEEREKVRKEELAREKEENRRRQVAELLPTEPLDSEDTLHIKFRLPEGEQVLRRFRKSETIETLINFLSSIGFEAHKHKFFNSNFPRQNIIENFHFEATFGETRWPRREQIFVEEI